MAEQGLEQQHSSGENSNTIPFPQDYNLEKDLVQEVQTVFKEKWEKIDEQLKAQIDYQSVANKEQQEAQQPD